MLLFYLYYNSCLIWKLAREVPAMWIRIDPQSPEPIFDQIVFQVKGAVARGQLSAGDRLPSVRELAKEVAVNPNTVIRFAGRSAIDCRSEAGQRAEPANFVDERNTNGND